MIQKISFINAFSSKNNFNKNNLKNSYTANPNQVSFKGIFDWTGFERGDYLCFETVDLVNKAKELAKQKKIEEKVFYAKDGTKITFSDAIFWQEYRFENKRKGFIDKYGKDDITCGVRGSKVVKCTIAPYRDERRMQKGTADIILMNYLPIVIEQM